jgi:hypothetical protein
MILQFIEIEIPLPSDRESTPIDPVMIHQRLLEYGNPLRWAITAIDPVSQTAKIEGIVTKD